MECGPELRNVGSILKLEQAGTILPWSLQKEHSLPNILILAHEAHFQTSELRNYNIIN